MSDRKMTLFSVQPFEGVEMTHQEANHRDIGEICDHNISHHHHTYIRVQPQVRHLNTVKGLDPFYRHFDVTHASCPHALTDRAPSVRSLPPFRQHIHHERNHP